MRRILTSVFANYSKKNIIMLGAPGVGKGSFASRTSDQLGMPHLTTGDMIRAEISTGSDLGLEFRSYSDAGDLVPDELVMALIMEQLNQVLADGTGCLLDGVPRTLGQVDLMQEMGVKLGGEDTDFYAVNLIQEEDVIIQKIVNRRVCEVCGDSYNFAIIETPGYDFPPLVPEVEGVCDKCGAVDSFIQRDDDKEDVVRNRLEVYHEQTEPIIAVFQDLGIIKEFVVDGGTKALMPVFIDFLSEF